MLFMNNQTPKIERVDDQSDQFYGKFVIEPLERGYGTTLGSALRRVLLSSIPGVALRSVRINGVLHEFSAIPGVVEDSTEILLNLKEIAFSMVGDGYDKSEIRELSLYRVGAGEVTAADIDLPSDLEIANPEHHIATLSSDDAKLDLTFELSYGTGFVAAENQNRKNMPIGTIPLDSIYTPIKQVAYRVDPTRVGSETDLDRLTLEVKTNGTVSPQTVISDAAKILDRYILLFFDLSNPNYMNGFGEGGQALPAGAEIKVSEIPFSVRTRNCLRKHNIATIGEILSFSESDLMGIKNFGKKSLNEVKDKLVELGLSLRDQDSKDKSKNAAAKNNSTVEETAE